MLRLLGSSNHWIGTLNKNHKPFYRDPELFLHKNAIIIAFDKERLHSAVEIENFGLCIHGHYFVPPPPSPRKIILGSGLAFILSASL